MFEKIKKVIADQLGIEEDKITPESSLVEDLKADSLDVAALLLELEEQYEIEIDEEDLDTLRTVGDIVSYVEKKVN